jgi:pimeloyl-ACP methyl ester carboxylesterase
MQPRPTTGRIDVPGGSLAYDRAGDGPPIVFVHAGIADRRMWNREFERYSDGSTVVRYDLRGLGGSTPATAPYLDWEDLHALIQQLELGPSVLVGCSMGGRAVVDFAVERPASVQGLLLVAAGVSGWGAEHDPSGQAVYDADMKRSAALPAAWSAGRTDEALEGLQKYWCSAQTGENLDLVQRMMRENAKEIFEEGSGRFSRPPSPPAVERLGSIRVPTTVLQGDLDEPTMGYISRDVARRIPGARLAPVRGADHLVNLSRPDAFDLALQELLLESRRSG